MSVLRQATEALEGTARVVGTPRPTWTAVALLGTDLVALVIAVLASSTTARFLGNAADPTPWLRFLPMLLLTPLAFAVVGLYPGSGLGPVVEARRIARALAASGVAYAVTVAFAWGQGALTLVPLGFAVVAFATVPAGRALMRELLARRRWWGAPAVLLADGRSVARAIDELARVPRLGLTPVACVLVDAHEGPTHLRGVPVVDASDVASATDRRTRPNLVVIDGAQRRTHGARLDVRALADVALVAPLDLAHVGLLGTTPTRVHRAIAAQGEPIDRPLPAQGVVKRGTDLLLAFPFAVAALPLIALAALAIAIVSPGTPFYYQVRTGLGGRPIRVWKLRTMYVDAAERLDRHLADDPAAHLEWSRSFKLTRDPRILPVVGRFLRSSSIDELPQVFNVLRGDMSFVGPRPFPEYHLDAFDDEFRRLRATVRPGITGLWQVTLRSDGDLEAQRALDTAYIQHWSLGLDLYLLARTPIAVLTARGAR